MLLDYFILNYMTLMILLGLVAMMFVNRDVKIPASHLFTVTLFIMLILTVIAMLNDSYDISGLSPEDARKVVISHTISCALNYMLRPFITLFEILIILDKKKYRIICSIPAIVNAVIFSTALFGSKIAFFISSDNHWFSGPLRNTIFIVQLFYLVLLVLVSVTSFKSKNMKRSIVLLVMCFQALLCALLEYNGVSPSYADAITALCILEYYVYLSIIYRQELKDKLDNYVNEVETSGQRLRKLTKEVITAFANSIDAKDKYTHGHSSRVAEYSRRIAELSGKSAEECDEIYYAGLLHDIGKIGVPENIITKEGKLTNDEYEKIKLHPTLGSQILGEIKEFPYLSVGAKGHHERYDGKGYPEGLKGTDIPEMARIISVADAYDAMSSKRSYRDPIAQQKVREEIVKGTGSQFDPEYARVMLHLIDEDLEYTMSEREEIDELAGKHGMIVDEYRSAVSDGILLTPAITTIHLSLMSDRDLNGEAIVPGILLFDSLDGKVHVREKEVKDLNYFEYGEIRQDLTTVTIGARKIIEKIKEEGDPSIEEVTDFKLEAVRIKDHAQIKIFGKDVCAEIIVALPDSSRYLYLGLTGEHCRYSNIVTDKAEEDSPADYIPRIAEEISYIDGPEGDIPNVQVDGYRTAHSEGVLVKDGLTITFHSKCLPTSRLVWHCPFIDLFASNTGVVYGESYRDLSFTRLDGECWECDPNVDLRLKVRKTDDFEGWDAWKAFNKEGFDATVSFKVNDNEVTILTENFGIAISNTVILTDINQPVFAAITGDQVAITNIRISC